MPTVTLTRKITKIASRLGFLRPGLAARSIGDCHATTVARAKPVPCQPKNLIKSTSYNEIEPSINRSMEELFALR